MPTLKSSGCVLSIASSPGNVFTDISRYHTPIVNTAVVTAKGLGNSLAGKYDGATAFLDIGDLNNTVNSVEMWCKPISIAVTEEILDLNGTQYIKATNGTITAEGSTAPAVYVNGILSAIITTGWNHIVATTTTAIDASDVDIGRLETSTYFNGAIFIARLYTRTLPLYEIEDLFLEYTAQLGVI